MDQSKADRLTELWNEKNPTLRGKRITLEPSQFYAAYDDISAYWSTSFIVIHDPESENCKIYKIPIYGRFDNEDAMLDWAIDKLTLTDIEMVRRYAL